MKSMISLVGCLLLSMNAFSVHANAQNFEKRIQTNLEPGWIEVSLTPQLPTPKLRMNWSPKGAQLELRKDDQGRLLTQMQLGPLATNPSMELALEKSDGSDYFDRLRIDTAGDGLDASDLVATCQPREQRGKVWSSFDFQHAIRFENADGQVSAENPIQLNLWYVVDPTEEANPPILRYNVAGWMQGETKVGDQTVHVLLYDYNMDGIYSTADTWSLAIDDKKALLFHVGSKRQADEYNWAGEKAYKIVKFSENGRTLVFELHDPGVTHEEDERQRDAYAKDRIAKRSGGQVTFLHDVDAAKRQAAEKGLSIFLDFETTWCGPCKIMDQLVYTADDVVNASEDWICVKVDGDEAKDLVAKYGVAAYPTIVLIQADGTLIKKAQGYQSVQAMTELLKADR